MMPKHKPLAGDPMSLRDATFKNEIVKQREGYNQLYQRPCLSQFTIQCQEIKNTRSVVTGMIFHSYNSPYNRGIKKWNFS